MPGSSNGTIVNTWLSGAGFWYALTGGSKPKRKERKNKLWWRTERSRMQSASPQTRVAAMSHACINHLITNTKQSSKGANTSRTRLAGDKALKERIQNASIGLVEAWSCRARLYRFHVAPPS